MKETSEPRGQRQQNVRRHWCCIWITLKELQVQMSHPSSKKESIKDPPGFLIIWMDSKFVLPCHFIKIINANNKRININYKSWPNAQRIYIMTKPSESKKNQTNATETNNRYAWNSWTLLEICYWGKLQEEQTNWTVKENSLLQIHGTIESITIWACVLKVLKPTYSKSQPKSRPRILVVKVGKWPWFIVGSILGPTFLEGKHRSWFILLIHEKMQMKNVQRGSI